MLSETAETSSIAEMCSIADLRTRYGIRRSTAYRLIAAGLIEARKVGSLTLIDLASVRRFLAAQPLVTVKLDARAEKLATRQAAQAEKLATSLAAQVETVQRDRHIREAAAA